MDALINVRGFVNPTQRPSYEHTFLICTFSSVLWLTGVRSLGRQKGKDGNLGGRALLCQRGESAEAGVRGRHGRKCGDGLQGGGSRATESPDKSPHCFVCTSVLSGDVWSRREAEFITQFKELSKISPTSVKSMNTPVVFMMYLLITVEQRRKISK